MKKKKYDLTATVGRDGFDGVFYDGGEKEKAIIVLSGSEGGLRISTALAEGYAKKGLSALALGIFATENTSQVLDRVPLEYMAQAIAWLRKKGYGKFAVDAISKGSEYALSCAARMPEISCVIARVPSWFVSEGLTGLKKRGPSGRSCWSYEGKELAFTPYEVREMHPLRSFFRHGCSFYLLDVNDKKAVTEESVIPVEQMQAALLLFSTEADTVWPSADAGKRIVKRLEEKSYSYPVRHVSYKYVSHFMIPAETKKTQKLMKLMFQTERKNAEACRRERADMMKITGEWLAGNF